MLWKQKFDGGLMLKLFASSLRRLPKLPFPIERRFSPRQMSTYISTDVLCECIISYRSLGPSFKLSISLGWQHPTFSMPSRDGRYLLVERSLSVKRPSTMSKEELAQLSSTG